MPFSFGFMNWQSIITDYTIKDSIKLKLEEIKKTLIANNNFLPNGNLLGGDLGCALFFLYYYYYTKDEENLTIAEKIILNAFEQISKNKNLQLSFERGLSGVCWFTEFLSAHQFLEINTNDNFSNIDKILSEYMLFEIQRGNYDYMHGALGPGLFFLQKKESENNNRNISKLISYLDKISIIEKNKIFRRWNYFHKGKHIVNGTNLGLSHGIPSILVFLTKCFKKNLDAKTKDLTQKLILDIIKYLLINIQDPNLDNTYFAYSIIEEVRRPQNTRLAWCYGDLGICCALWQANLIVNDENLKDKIIEVLRYNAKRRVLEENMVFDAGICHGTAGIAHIFNRFYHATNIEEFKETAFYWYNQTLQMARFKNGLAGYKTHIKGPAMEFENCSGFLEGVAGIGLVMISSISNIEPSWDEFLLIS